MSIIIRLQNLPWSANALDIRQYFSGLQIPEGGVHIVGGELGDAFIAFSTDEDARQAFLRNDGKIKSVQISLMLSSRTEMQRVIEQARTQSMAAFMLPANTPAAPLPAAVPPVVLPPVIPAAIPEINRDSKEKDSEKKRDRKRSRTRSKSRDRRDRSRDRKDRRHRDRSRSRSRDRRDRRRRDRSKSRNRSRDKDTRRKDRAKTTPKRDEGELSPFQREGRKSMPEVWANLPAPKPPVLNIIPPRGISDGPGLLGAFPPMDHSMKRTIINNNMGRNLSPNNMGRNLSPPDLNGFNPSRERAFGMSNPPPIIPRQRESWPPANVVPPGGVPVAVSDAQRQTIMDSFERPMSSLPPNIDNIRGNREDPRKEMNIREKDMAKMNAPPMFSNRAENNSRRSRFEDVDAPPVDACISMEPFYGSYGDLRRFFNGLSINYKGIKVINDEFGCKTGVCFVQFRDASIKNEALKMNGKNLNKIAIKIQHITDQVFEDAIDRYNPRMDEDNENSDQFGRSRNISKFFKNNTNPEPPLKDFVCLKVEDLPTFVKEQDILHIFSQHPLISLHLNFKPKGGNVAYVKFSSKEVAKLALAEKSHHVISGKTVTVKPCKDEEFEEVNKDQNVVLEEAKPKEIDTDCLSLSNLPGKTNDRDISDFFSDIGVLPTKIHLMSNNMGFTGQAYCEFDSKEEAAKGLGKDNTTLGPNTIKVVAIPRAEMEGILNNTLPHPGTPKGLPLPPGTPLPPIKSEMAIQLDAFVNTMKDAPKPDTEKPPSEKPDEITIKPLIPLNELVKTPHIIPPLIPQSDSPMVPVGSDLKEPRGFQGSFDGPRNFNGPRHVFNGPRGGHDGFGPRGGLDRFEGPRGLHNFEDPDNGDDFNGPRGGHDNFGPRGGPGPRMSRFDNRGGSRFNGPDEGPRFDAHDEPRFRFSRDGINKNPRFNPSMDTDDNGGFEDMPGCTVYMENVPYKAGTNEILDFFEGYNSTNNVSRRYNPNNTPSSEAKVTFYTPEDAFRAVRELHGAKIWGRSIFLRQA